MTNKKDLNLLYKEKIDYFKKEDNIFFKKNSILLESLIIIGIVCFFSIYAFNADVFESLVTWTRTHEHYELDEALVVLILLAFGFGIFSVRRFIDLKREMKFREEAEKKIYEYALFDTLTGLPNRYVFEQNLETAISKLEEDSQKLAVCMIDIDRFKYINDTYGHEVGDSLLSIAAKRIKSVLREGDTVSRLGGDEFTVIQNNISSPEAPLKLCDRIIDAFHDGIHIGDLNIFITVSIGITICSTNKDNPSKLLREADIAMYRAKEEKKFSSYLFNKEMGIEFTQRQRIINDLREAAIKEEFELYYQPQFTANKKLLGFEALLRWNHPRRGMISPGVFIPMAEEIGLIETIDEWVLREACKAAANWDEELIISVNISATQFKNIDLIEKLQNTLYLTGLNPRRLEIEITERVLIADTTFAKENIFDIKKLGAKIIMDDFGTGYSSLSYLRELPFDKVKIDKSFINNLEHEDRDLYIIKAIVDLTEALGISIIAEGVETEEQKKRLTLVGCNNIQGFLFGKPRPLTETEELLKEEGFHIKKSQQKQGF